MKLGVARNAREEKARAREEAQRKQELENQRMAALYREHILGEKPGEPLLQVEVRKKPASPEGEAHCPHRRVAFENGASE